MDFAPYQNDDPETERAKSPPPPRVRSPPPRSPQSPQSPQSQRNIGGIAVNSDDPWAAARAQRLPSPSQFADDEGYSDLEGGRQQQQGGYNDYIGSDALQGGGVTGGSVFETSLGFPLRVEACLAYLLLPPAGGVVLLLFEHKSDYVRFHAWQSALLFSAIFLLHIIFSFSAIVSWILLAFDLLTIAYLTVGAWRNGDTLDRVEVPFFGRLASSFVDDE